MRFCDLFLEYKLLARTTNKIIKWHDLPMKRKIFVMISFVEIVMLLIAALTQNIQLIYIISAITVVLSIIMFILLSRYRDVKKMLEQYYKPYSKEHIEDVIKLLSVYTIDINDEVRLQKIIKMAQSEKQKNNPFTYIINPIKIVFAASLPIIGYFLKRMADQANQLELLTTMFIIIAVVILCLSIALALKPFVMMLFFSDELRYEEFIYDLEQVMIFKSGKSVSKEAIKLTDSNGKLVN